MSSESIDVELAARIAGGFSVELRRSGLAAPLATTIEFTRALLLLTPLERGPTYWAGRSLYARSPEAVVEYDRAFAHFFSRLPVASSFQVTVPLVIRGTEESIEPPTRVDGAEPAPGARFSATEHLAQADLATLSAQEAAEVGRLIDALRSGSSLVRTRRYERASAGDGRLDLRRSIARSLRTDGELVLRRYRKRRARVRRVVVLCDVSGSMEPYARAMLRFGYGVVRAQARAEVFTMGTRLTRLTTAFRSRDARGALTAASDEILDWSGGTRLGEVMHDFNERYGLRSLARQSTIVVCSDGIDRGDPALIAREMGRLARVAHRIIWVNPLKSTPGYEPRARGMAAALPFVDEFLPGDSFAALEAVAQELGMANRHPLVTAR